MTCADKSPELNTGDALNGDRERVMFALIEENKSLRAAIFDHLPRDPADDTPRDRRLRAALTPDY